MRYILCALALLAEVVVTYAKTDYKYLIALQGNNRIKVLVFDSAFAKSRVAYECRYPKEESLVSTSYNSSYSQPAVQVNPRTGRLILATWDGSEGGCEDEGYSGAVRLHIYDGAKKQKTFVLQKDAFMQSMQWKYIAEREVVIYHTGQDSALIELNLTTGNRDTLLTTDVPPYTLRTTSFAYSNGMLTFAYEKGEVGDTLVIHKLNLLNRVHSSRIIGLKGSYAGSRGEMHLSRPFMSDSLFITTSAGVRDAIVPISNTHTAWVDDTSFLAIARKEILRLDTAPRIMDRYPLAAGFIYEVLRSGVFVSHDPNDRIKYSLIRRDGAIQPADLAPNSDIEAIVEME